MPRPRDALRSASACGMAAEPGLVGGRHGRRHRSFHLRTCREERFRRRAAYCHVCTPGQRSPAGLHGPHVNRCPWPLTNSRPPGTDHVPAKQVLAGLLSRQAAEGRAYNRVLYVGDGRGDFCPSALLLHGSNGAAAAAAPPDAAAMPGGGAVGTAAPAPCGSASNVVFAREEYPDGAPCSLWVMLQQAHSVHSGGGRASGEAPQEAAAGGAARRAGGSGTSGGVVGWTTPEQLASLIRAELQLELELR